MIDATPASSSASASVGDLLRGWRQRRRLSQLALALEAGISQRHLSFVESGRSAPSREMLVRLAEHLSIPLRTRNALLVAGGFAPMYRERSFDDPDLAAARRAVDLILAGHEPYPALAIDRHWNLVTANGSVAHLTAGIDEAILEPPVNVLRLSLDPRGLAPRLRNLREWRTHVFDRLRRQIDASGDPGLVDLLEELKATPLPPGTPPEQRPERPSLGGIAVPMEIAAGDDTLSFVSTTTVFGTALDVLLSELAIESFFPADRFTAEAMARLAQET